MKDKTLRAIYLLFLVMGCIIVGISAFAIRAINRDAQSADWVNQTHATIYEIDAMMSEFQAGEGMLRTFALSGDARDFAECKSAFYAVLEHHSIAKAMTRDHADVQASLGQLETTAQARLELSDTLRKLVDARRTDEVRKALQDGAGTMTTAEFKRTIAKLRNHQFELLTQRDRESYERAQVTRLVVGLGVGTNLLLFVVVAWLIRDTLATRRKLTDTLERANVVLEQKVKERTAELTSANRSLTRENLERKWTTFSQERQLRYSNAIVNTVSDLVFVLSKALNVTRLNPAVAHATGLAEEQILGRPIAQVLRLPAAADGSSATDRLARAVNEGRELTDFPAEVLDREGKARPGFLSVVPLHDDNVVVGAVVVLRLASPL